jgi:hypothetical protein
MAPRRGVDGEIEQVRDTARGGRRLLRLGGDDPAQQDAEAPDLRALGDAEGENPQGVAAEGWQRPWGRDRAAL